MASLGALFSVFDNYRMKIFPIVFQKNAERPINRVSIYTMGLQCLVERFSLFLEEQGENDKGVVVDSRVHGIDYQISLSVLSFLFDHDAGRTFTNIVEGPLFVDSRTSPGVQLVDIICSCIYGSSYYRNCKDIPNALDYSDLDWLQPILQAHTFVSLTQHQGRIVHGMRYIQH